MSEYRSIQMDIVTDQREVDIVWKFVIMKPNKTEGVDLWIGMKN